MLKTPPPHYPFSPFIAQNENPLPLRQQMPRHNTPPAPRNENHKLRTPPAIVLTIERYQIHDPCPPAPRQVHARRDLEPQVHGTVRVGVRVRSQGDVVVAPHQTVRGFDHSLAHDECGVLVGERGAIAVPFEDPGCVEDRHVPGVFYGAEQGEGVIVGLYLWWVGGAALLLTRGRSLEWWVIAE